MTNEQQQQEAFEEFLQEFARFQARAKEILGVGTSTEDIRSLYASWRIDSRNGNPYAIPNGKNGHAAQPHTPPPPAEPGSIRDATQRAQQPANGGYTKPPATAPAPDDAPLTPGSGLGKSRRAEPRPHRAGNGNGDATPAQRFAYGLAREIAKQRQGNWKEIMDAYCSAYDVHRFEDLQPQDLSDVLDEMKKAAGRE